MPFDAGVDGVTEGVNCPPPASPPLTIVKSIDIPPRIW